MKSSAEDAVKGSWIRDNGLFYPDAFFNEQQQSRSRSSTAQQQPQTVSGSTTSLHESLRHYWRLATQLLIEESSSLLPSEQSERERLLETWWDRLIHQHSEDTRHYHTTVHLWEMIQYWDLLQSAESDTTESAKPPKEGPVGVIVDVVLLLSIFFHDAVYDAKSGSNEEDSARLFERFAEELGLQLSIRTAVVDYIMATKMHQISTNETTSEGSFALRKSLALFLDLDMAVLGKNSPAYRQYAALIRHEYSFVPHDEYCRKRADVLAAFGQQPRIYATPVLYTALEQPARRNLRHEIDSLRQGVIPGTPTTLNEQDIYD